MLEVKNITKYYGDLCAVNNLSFKVNKGEIFGLLGVNGSGKTTTFRIIMGLLEPDNGEVLLDGKKIDYSVTDTIGFLPEERSLLTKLTVKEQCYYYGALKGMSEEQIDSKLDYYLKLFEIEDYRDKKIKELSKGNQQKIQFITAVMNDPKLLILDEPFSGLDPFNIELFKKVIVELSNNGSTIIFSSHRMEHVELFCKKISIIIKGKEVLAGEIKKIKEKYKKKNLLLISDVNINKLNKIEGILDITNNNDEYIIKISDESIASKIFDVIKNSSVKKFVIEQPSLNEIFIDKVGESYEK